MSEGGRGGEREGGATHFQSKRRASPAHLQIKISIRVIVDPDWVVPLRVVLVDRPEVQPGQRLVGDVLKFHPTSIAEEQETPSVELEVWPASDTAGYRGGREEGREGGPEIVHESGTGKERGEGEISFVGSFVRSFVRSFVHSFVSSFVRSFVSLFVRSLVCSFVRSFERSSVSCSFDSSRAHVDLLHTTYSFATS